MIEGCRGVVVLPKQWARVITLAKEQDMSDRGSRSAYPNPAHGNSGMTIREEFAARAMQGLLANPDIVAPVAKLPVEMQDTYASMAVCNADALLRELEKGANDEKV